MHQRIDRLQKLCIRLGKEVAIWRKQGKLVLLSAEREAYLAAIQDAIAGGVKAGDVLEKAIARLEESRRR